METKVKKIIIVFVTSFLLVFPTSNNLITSNTTNSSWAQELSEQSEHLEDLNLLKSIMGIEEESHITDSVETKKALIYCLDGTEIPRFLETDFSRIYAMVVHYFNLDDRGEKIVDWAIGFDGLQEMPPGKETCLGGCPTVLASMYYPPQNFLFFTPRYMNDYYVTHELIHYFIDEYEDVVIEALPEVITRENRSGLALRDFVKQNEEEITINLAQIIIRKSLAGYVLQGSRCTCEPETMLDITHNVVCTCVRPPEEMIIDENIDCIGCHGTEEEGKFVSQ